MSFLAPVASALLPAAGLALGGLFGGSDSPPPKVNYTPPGFNAGGLSATFSGNNYGISASPDRMAAVGNVASTFGQQASDIAGLRSQWAPGSSALRSSLLTALGNQRTQALGNLRDNLAQRRILGSSFAQNSLATADQQYQQGIKEIMDQTFLQELQAQQTLIQQQYGAARSQYQTNLDEMNLEAGLAADLTGKASAALNSAAQAQAQLDAKAAAGKGSFFGQLGQTLGSGIGKLLGGGSGGGGGTDPTALLS